MAQLVEAKQQGQSIDRAESPADPTNVINLMDALQESVDRAKGRGRARKKKGAPKKKGASKKGEARERLEDLTKDQLYRRASDAGVSGRSSMNREELIKALTGRGSRRAAS
ncbi:hypothetical protein [Streptomyces odontomachi]|uniref:hypothetical protein n=1 Tax=Streptomyces odontomachi TaxID=2944940 RepID=UPI00210ACFD8|nr:hypothetical protein [Streptomyces sp. ODS25]